MSWQSALARAQRELSREETGIARELELVRTKIARLTAISGGGPAWSGKATTRKLSPQGRAAIIRGAKKRWARYRAERRGRASG